MYVYMYIYIYVYIYICIYIYIYIYIYSIYHVQMQNSIFLNMSRSFISNLFLTYFEIPFGFLSEVFKNFLELHILT